MLSRPQAKSDAASRGSYIPLTSTARDKPAYFASYCRLSWTGCNTVTGHATSRSALGDGTNATAHHWQIPQGSRHVVLHERPRVVGSLGLGSPNRAAGRIASARLALSSSGLGHIAPPRVNAAGRSRSIGPCRRPARRLGPAPARPVWDTGPADRPPTTAYGLPPRCANRPAQMCRSLGPSNVSICSIKHSHGLPAGTVWFSHMSFFS